MAWTAAGLKAGPRATALVRPSGRRRHPPVSAKSIRPDPGRRLWSGLQAGGPTRPGGLRSTRASSTSPSTSPRPLAEQDVLVKLYELVVALALIAGARDHHQAIQVRVAGRAGEALPHPVLEALFDERELPFLG